MISNRHFDKGRLSMISTVFALFRMIDQIRQNTKLKSIKFGKAKAKSSLFLSFIIIGTENTNQEKKVKNKRFTKMNRNAINTYQ